ncbi:hypothetical protein ACH5RR_020244 [Cinchona calisaya]|uniref:Pentatricopeptide repeat-containing protein n=1 Tax=Cinchona calisaya TaxID=153742 RepID=A0ABD2ZDX4_9GENT
MEGKIGEAVELFKKISMKLGSQPHSKTWGTLINALCWSGYSEKALELHRKMRSVTAVSGLMFKSNLVCYSTIISGLCEEGLVDKEITVFGDGGRRDFFRCDCLWCVNSWFVIWVSVRRPRFCLIKWWIEGFDPM